MRYHGFEYKRPDDVSLDDWIVTESRPLGESEHVRTVEKAFKVAAIARSMQQYGWVYTFTLDGGDHSYTVPETALVPVSDGPS